MNHPSEARTEQEKDAEASPAPLGHTYIRRNAHTNPAPAVMTSTKQQSRTVIQNNMVQKRRHQQRDHHHSGLSEMMVMGLTELCLHSFEMFCHDRLL